VNYVQSKFLSLSTLLLVMSTVLVGCFSHYDMYDPPPPQHIYNYAGDWQGSLKEQSANPRTATIDLNILEHEFTKKEDFNYNSQPYYSLKGTWSAGFSPEVKAYGVFLGNADTYSTNFTATLNFSSNTNCDVWVDGTRQDTKIAGIYYLIEKTENGCSEIDLTAGTFEISKK